MADHAGLFVSDFGFGLGTDTTLHTLVWSGILRETIWSGVLKLESFSLA